MSWLSRNPLAVMALIVVAVILVVLFVPLPNAGDHADAGVGPAPTLSPRPEPEFTKAAEGRSREQVVGERPQGSTMTFEGQPGLLGEGASSSTRVRDVRLAVTSDEPVWVLGYLVPTSPDRSNGTVRKPGASWSMSTKVYGRPDYAQIFAQAGPRATRISCTVTVDGRVTERRTATGPYAQLFCQG